jgi:SanA protein
MMFLLMALACALLAPFALRGYTSWRFDDDVHSIDSAPSKRVAIIFGAQVTRRGNLSTMLRDRVETGIDLYEAGKVEVLLMSGDGRTDSYNEPATMRAYALERGIPADAILTDQAGLRTYDTCYRARDEFGLTDAILVTQEFHLDRALFICNGLGVDAVGVYADYHRPYGYSQRAMGWSRWREVAATTMAALDLLRGRTPAVRPASLLAGDG